ncbi:MAG: DUF1643 domain-containing protein [Planctomycetaceae bacterium]|nr:DUF1643 domain-containing protein [Planctomycetaceae bacterium]
MSAVFSDCERYRYLLRRNYLTGEGTVTFLLLNPSTADASKDDPTVKRCSVRARTMGFRSMLVVNLFAWRSTDPAGMLAADEPVGADNDRYILEAVDQSRMVVCGWGEPGSHRGRSRHVLELLQHCRLHALKVNDSGEPGHPLYLGYDLEPSLWKEGAPTR